MPQVKSLAQNNEPKLMLFSETRTIENMTNSELNVNGYNLFRCDSKNRHTGGVAIYVKDSISAHEIFKFNNNFIWAIAINITKGFSNECFCGIYRGHQSTDSDFSEFFSDLCDKLLEFNSFIHIFGDVNYDFLKSKNAKIINKIAKSFCLKQLVTEPTRITNGTSTLIDWYLTNKKNVKCIVECDNLIADHHFITVNLFHKDKMVTNNKIINDWSKYNSESLLQALNNVEWINYSNCNDANSKCEFIFNNLEKIINLLVSKKTIKICYSLKWFNKELSDLKKLKIEAYNEWKINKSDDTWNIYRKIRNNYKDSLTLAEQNYVQNQLELYKYDFNKLWSTLKACYADIPSSLSCIQYENGDIITDDKLNTENINNYMVESIDTIATKIPKVNYNFDIIKPNNNCEIFDFKEESVDALNLIIKKLNKKTFFDNINGKVMIDAMKHEKFKNAFCDMINTSLKSGIFPNIFKSSTVIPIQKVKNTIKVNELRAINKLKVPEIILEKVARNQLCDHFESNELFIDEQSGFRRNHSCESAINLLLHEWKFSLEKNKIVLVVFIDLKRAFETIDRNLLVKKLSQYSCSNNVSNWFNSYLTNRKQRTKFNNDFSQEIAVNIGIPQGSVLSCLLFIIFINDIKAVFIFSIIRLFADDTLIEIECDNIADGFKKLQVDLNNLFNYLCACKLSLNVDKTKFMIVSTKKVRQDDELMLNNSKIEQVKEFKYLGVMLDDRLTMEAHTDFICKKLNKKFFVFKRCEKKLNLAGKLSFCSSLVLPHFDSCGSILFLLNNSQINRIQVIQNRFMRTVLRRDSRTHISDMLNDLHWMSISQRIHYNSIKFIHKIAMGNAPQYLENKIVRVNQIHSRSTRQNNNFYIPLCTKETTRNLLLIKCLKIYNDVTTQYENQIDNNNISFVKFTAKYVREKF